MNFTFRPYVETDAPAIAEILNAVEVHVGSPPAYTAGEVRDWLSTLPDPAANSRVVVGPDSSVAAFGVVSPPPDGGFRVDMGGEVDPVWRGNGIGRDLFGWQLTRAEEIYRATAPDIEWIADSGTNVRDTDAIHLFERYGLSVRRYWSSMDASTASAISTPIDGFRVESGEAVNPQALYEAHMEAFEDHFGYQRRSFAEWSGHSVASSLYRPDLSRIAYDGNEIVSYVLSYDEAAPDRLYIGQVGTRRPWRGRRLASGLLVNVLAAGAKAGKQVANLGVDATNPTGAVGVYERAGFAVVARAITYAKVLGNV